MQHHLASASAIASDATAQAQAAQRLRLASLVTAPSQGMNQMVFPSTTAVSAAPAEAPDAVTTIMFRNIPLKYTRDTLLEDMDQRGFKGSYDFFYLPIDFGTKFSVGYAFINFVSEAEVARFKKVYQGLQLASDSAKVCEICPAKVQGKDRNVEVYRNSAVMLMEESYHPAIFDNGVKQVFPKPTHPPKPYRPRADKR